MSPILHRYFTRELLKVFFLFIFCFFFLYTLLDYTSRLSSLGLNFSELVVMYSCILLRRIEILAPFALLVAGIKVLCQANVRNELVALRGCGLPLQRLLSPLLTVGLAFTALMYLNLQFAVPFAQRQIREIEDTYSGRFKRSSHPVQGLSMNDGQHLQAIVISETFAGMPLIKQHQMIMKPLKDTLAHSVHALGLKTFTPEKWETVKDLYGL